MEQQIKDLIECVKSLIREVAQLKEAEAERRMREVEEREARE